jgi:hypothetical protein
MSVQVTRVVLPTEHENQKWLVLKGEIEGCPEVTKTRSINTSALASGALILDEEKAKLVADVEEYFVRWTAVQQALTEL